MDRWSPIKLCLLPALGLLCLLVLAAATPANAGLTDWKIAFTAEGEYRQTPDSPPASDDGGPNGNIIGVDPGAIDGDGQSVGSFGEDLRDLPPLDHKLNVCSVHDPRSEPEWGLTSPSGGVVRLATDIRAPVTPADPRKRWLRVRVEAGNYILSPNLPGRQDRITLRWTLRDVPPEIQLRLKSTLISGGSLNMKASAQFSFTLNASRPFTEFEVEASLGTALPLTVFITNNPFSLSQGQQFVFNAVSGPEGSEPLQWSIVQGPGSLQPGPDSHTAQYVAPASVTTTTPVTVRVAHQAAPSVSHQVTFNLVPPSVPGRQLRIDRFTPERGVVGITVTVEGEGFEPDVRNNQLYFTGNALAQILSATTTTLRVIVPAAAQDGPLTVVARGDRATSAQWFIVDRPTGQLQIDSIYPEAGVGPLLDWEKELLEDPEWFVGTILPGPLLQGPTEVELEVRGWSAPVGTPVEVHFNGRRAPTPSVVGTGSERLVRARVPKDATSGPVTLRVGTSLAASPNPFTVYPRPSITDAFVIDHQTQQRRPLFQGRPNDSLVIRGRNLCPDRGGFGEPPGRTLVKFTGLRPIELPGLPEHINPVMEIEQVFVTIPMGAKPGPIYLISQTAYGVTAFPRYETIGIAPYPLEFVPLQDPEITGFEPKVGTFETLVEIRGTHLDLQQTGFNQVIFSGGPEGEGAEGAVLEAGTKDDPTFGDVEYLKVLVPQWAATGPITLRTRSGQRTTDDSFEVFPVLTNFRATATDRTVTLTWNTNVPTETLLARTAGVTTLPPGLRTSHQVLVEGLQPGTKYVFQALAKRGSQIREVLSPLLEVTTTRERLVVSNLMISGGVGSAGIFWQSSKPATGVLWYRLSGTTSWQEVSSDAGVGLTHHVQLKNLNHDTLYDVRVGAQNRDQYDDAEPVDANFYTDFEITVRNTPATVQAGSTGRFDAVTTSPRDSGVIWTIEGGSVPRSLWGSFDAAGTYTTADRALITQEITLTAVATAKVSSRATGRTDPTVRATRTFRVVPLASITLEIVDDPARPNDAVLRPGESVSLTGTLTPAGGGVLWTVSGAVPQWLTGGGESATVANTFSVPPTSTVVGQVTITATSKAYPSAKASVVLTLKPRVALTLTRDPADATYYYRRGDRAVTLLPSGRDGAESVPAAAIDVAMVSQLPSGLPASSYGTYNSLTRVYTPPEIPPVAGLRVTFRATYRGDPGAAAENVLIVKPRPILKLTPATFTVHAGKVFGFQLSADLGAGEAKPNALGLPVQPSASPGTIAPVTSDPSRAVYTAPQSVTGPTPARVTLSAEGAQDAVAQGTVLPPLRVEIQDKDKLPLLEPGKPINLAAVVRNAAPGEEPVEWEVGLPPGTTGDPGQITFFYSPEAVQTATYRPPATVPSSGAVVVRAYAQVDRGVMDQVTLTFADTNKPPVATPQSLTTNEDTPLAVTLAGSDPEGASLTYSVVTQPQHGTLTGTAPSLTYTPAKDYHGSDSFSFTVSDGKATSAPATVSITIRSVNDSPVLTVPGPQTVDEGKELTFTLPAATDADGDTLTYGMSAPVPGPTFNAATRVFRWTPTYDQAGAHTITFTVSDGKGGTDQKTVVVTVNNVPRPPTAEAQTVEVLEDQPKEITLSGTAPEAAGGPVFRITTQPLRGRITGTPPKVTYEPAKDAFGDDSFVFEVSDGSSQPATARVTLRVLPVNDAPSFTKGPDQTVQDDAGPQTVPGWATGISAGPANESGQTLEFLVTTNNDALFSVLPRIAPDGTLTYEPKRGASGTATVTVRLRDNGGTANGGVDTSAPQTFAIRVNVGNRPPTGGAVRLSDTAPRTKDTLTATVYEPSSDDGGSVVYTYRWVRHRGGVETVVKTTEKTAAATDTLDLSVPGNGDRGDVIEVRVIPSDGTLEGAVFTTAPGGNATVQNTPPELSDLSSVTLAEGEERRFTLRATDDDGDVLLYSVGAAVQGAEPPDWVAVNQTTGEVVLRPARGDQGQYALTFFVVDTARGSDNRNVTVTVTPANQAPTLTLPAALTVRENEPLSQAVTAEDPDGDTVTLTAADLPEGAAFTLDTAVSGRGTLTWTPTYDQGRAEPYVLRFTARDPWGAETVKTLAVTVIHVNRPPVAGDDSLEVTQDTELHIRVTDLLANDTDPDGDAPLTLTNVVATADTHGAVTLNGTLISYLPDRGYRGVAVFLYTVTDGKEASTGLVTVVVAPDGSEPPALAETPWPMFRHDPQHTGRSGFSGPPEARILWEQPLQALYASPAVGIDRTLYINSRGEALVALNPDGSRRWAFGQADWVRSSPAIASDGTIYVGLPGIAGSSLVALTPTGQEKWKVPLAGDVQSSPAIGRDGTVYVGSGTVLNAIGPDGVRKWTFPTLSLVVSSPALSHDEQTVYFGSDDGYLYAVSLEGQLRWRKDTGRGIRSSPSVGRDGTITVGSTNGTFYAYWPDGSLRWSVKMGQSISASPALGLDGTIYAGGDDGVLRALTEEGEERWSYPVGTPITGSPAVDKDGVVYFGSDRKVYAVDRDGKLKWSLDLGSRVLSSPIIGADQTLLVGSESKLTLLGAGTNQGKLGDANGDGRFLITDVVVALRVVAGLQDLEPARRALLDVDGVNGFNVLDIVLMLRRIAGLIPKFPVEP